MKKLSTTSIAAGMTALLLLAVLVPAAYAEEVTLVGQLAESEAGGYQLIEQGSGESITITGPSSELEMNVGKTVKLTGEWVKDESGSKYFAASKVEPAS